MDLGLIILRVAPAANHAVEFVWKAEHIGMQSIQQKPRQSVVCSRSICTLELQALPNVFCLLPRKRWEECVPFDGLCLPTISASKCQQCSKADSELTLLLLLILGLLPLPQPRSQHAMISFYMNKYAALQMQGACCFTEVWPCVFNVCWFTKAWPFSMS